MHCSFVKKTPSVSVVPNIHLILSSGLKVGPLIVISSPPSTLLTEWLLNTGKEPVKLKTQSHD